MMGVLFLGAIRHDLSGTGRSLFRNVILVGDIVVHKLYLAVVITMRFTHPLSMIGQGSFNFVH
jgi:hypothetical protein